MPFSVVIVENRHLVREGLVHLVEACPEAVVSASCSEVGHALECLERFEPTVCLVSLDLGNGSAWDVIAGAARRGFTTAMVAMSVYDESVWGTRAVRAGAVGFVSLSQPSTFLRDAITRAAAGRLAFCDDTLRRSVQAGLGGSNGHGPFDNLSNREMQVFRLLGEGLAYADVAEGLCISVRTVQKHAENIRKRLALEPGARVRQAAMRWALSHTAGTPAVPD